MSNANAPAAAADDGSAIKARVIRSQNRHEVLFESADEDEAIAWARRYTVRAGLRGQGEQCPRVELVPSGMIVRPDLPGRDRAAFQNAWNEARGAVAAETEGRP